MDWYQIQTPLIPKEHININNLDYDVFSDVPVCEHNDQTEGEFIGLNLPEGAYITSAPLHWMHTEDVSIPQ